MSEKKYAMIKIIAWSAIAILLTVFLASNVWGYGWNIFDSNFNKAIVLSDNYKVVKEYKFNNVRNIKNITTDLSCSDVIFSHNKEDNIKVIIRANKNVKDKNYITASKKSDTVNIRDNGNRSKFNLNGLSMEAEIMIPDSYEGNLNISNNVGDIDVISDLKFDNIDITLKTGDIDISNKLTANKITINNKVGDFDADTLVAKDITVESKTGDIEIENFNGEGSITTDIGDIDCSIDDLSGNFNINSRVGDVDLLVNDNLDFIFKGNKSFDNLDTDMKFDNVSMSSKSFRGSYGNSSKNTINVNIKTGDIGINTK